MLNLLLHEKPFATTPLLVRHGSLIYLLIFFTYTSWSYCYSFLENNAFIYSLKISCSLLWSYIPLPQLLPDSSQLPYHPNFIPQLLKTKQTILPPVCVGWYSWVCGLPWIVTNTLSFVQLKTTDFLSPSSNYMPTVSLARHEIFF